MNANVSLVVGNVTHIKSGTTVNDGVSVKIQNNIMCVEKSIFGILLKVAKMVNIQEGLFMIQ